MKGVIVKDFKSRWLTYTASLRGITIEQAEFRYGFKYKLDDVHNEIAGKEIDLEVDWSSSGYGYFLKDNLLGIHISQVESIKE